MSQGISTARAEAEQKPAPAAPPGPAAPAAMPEPAQQFGSSARDLGAIRRAVEDAASVGVGLWLSYLFVFFYIGIAAGSVTHKDLLLENPVKLPFLGVELPLVAFFLLAPLLFIVSHGYTLMHFVMLAGKVGLFDEELNKQLPAAPEIQDGIRRELPSNIFVQLLAGPQDVRHGKLGMLLTAVAWITLVIGPVLLLLLIQIQFLPYHEKWVTGAHRIAIVADVVLLWLLWPAVLNRRSRLMWRLEPRGSGFSSALSLAGRYSAALAACFIPLFIALAAATFPGERLDDWIGNKKWIPLPSRMSNGPRKSGYQPQWTSLHDLLFNLPYDSERRRRKSPFSNTLVLPGFDALEALKISGKDLGAAKQTIDLRGRHLEGAIFAGAGLPKAYFGNAHLEGASFYQAKLQGAGFYQAQLQGADLYQAQLQSASLDSAHLEGARLDGAELQGAWLYSAGLSGASLKEAHLEAAWLQGAQLQGASLEGAQLQGASFQESLLSSTDMSGAALWRTGFEKASLGTLLLGKGIVERAISPGDFNAIQDRIRQAPETEDRKNALVRIEKLKSEILPGEARVSELLAAARAEKEAYARSLAEKLEGLICSGVPPAVYILRGLIVNGRTAGAGIFAQDLAGKVLAPDCPAYSRLTDEDEAALKQIARDSAAGTRKP